MSLLPKQLLDLFDHPSTVPSFEKAMLPFTLFLPKETKVIILAEETYCREYDATGLAFSIDHKKPPYATKNILTALKRDIKCPLPRVADFKQWAEQGVLLVNVRPTTKKNKKAAHAGIGWEEKTKELIDVALSYRQPIVIMAWGKKMQAYAGSLNICAKTLILGGPHPSRPEFIKCHHFSKANEWLLENGVAPINWRLRV